MNEDLVTLVTTARFTPVIRQGYVMTAVDDLLDRLAARLSAGGPVKPMIEAARLPLASWQDTYDRDEVDLLLAQVRHKAQVRDTWTEEEDTPDVLAEGPRIPAPRTEADVEQKGLLSRLFGAR